ERLARYAGPFLHGEGARKAGRAVQGDERRFDEDRARAAAGIVEPLPRVPAALQNQRRRQRLAQGRFAVPRAVAALGERFARGVDADRDQIAADADVDLKERARLAEPVLVIRA